ncbi:MAG: tRNA threonylcarbamoyladenosine biosynthesis protein TsaB [Ruminococcus sp.]
MRILGIDTSGKVAAAALYDSESRCLLAQQTVYTKRTHSQVILPLAERLLADTGLNWQDVDGFAAAKVGFLHRAAHRHCGGKSHVLRPAIPCVGIYAGRAGVAESVLAGRDLCGHDGETVSVYAGLYQSDGTQITAMQPDGMQPAAELAQQLASLEQPVLLAGDAVELFRAEQGLTIASPMTRLQNGTGICPRGAGTVADPGRTDAGVFAAGESGKGLAGETAGKVIFVYLGKYTLQLSGKYAIIEVSQDKGVRRT